MKPFALVAVLVGALFTLGCGGGIAPPVNPDQAGTALRAALDAWKQGEAYESLAKRSSPIYFREPEWEAGKTLVQYQPGTVELVGRQGRCSVKLSLRDQAGKMTEREISYIIDTTPRVVIVREQLGM